MQQQILAQQRDAMQGRIADQGAREIVGAAVAEQERTRAADNDQLRALLERLIVRVQAHDDRLTNTEARLATAEQVRQQQAIVNDAVAVLRTDVDQLAPTIPRFAASMEYLRDRMDSLDGFTSTPNSMSDMHETLLIKLQRQIEDLPSRFSLLEVNRGTAQSQ